MQKKSKRKQANTKHTQTTTSPPTAKTQVCYMPSGLDLKLNNYCKKVCYMPCNAKLRRQVKHNDNRTGKEYQQEVSPNL